MNNIEQRIVKMVFDNHAFENGAKATIKTLETLASKLHVLETTKGLANLGKTVAAFPLDTLSGAVSSFDSLIARATVLNRVVGDVYNIIKGMVKSLVIDPVSTGFSEYEEKMGAVQTIMLSTGKSLDVVMDRLEELNHYADKTIYSFSDMTKNIAKFTNAGVDLDIAVKAIQGLSNEAAVSGATATEASRAMYNVSQALSMGYMQYIDWKSIENANMATVEFKQNLVNTAKSMGTLTQETIDSYSSIQGLFKDELKEGWLTNDVLLTTLQMYTDETTELGKKATAAAQEVRTFTMLMDTLKEAAQSGWGQTWEIIIGDYNESKKLFTRISKAISKIMDDSADARNTLLKEWKALGGRDSVIEAVADTFNRLQKVVKTVKKSFNEVFPKKTAQDLKKFSDGIVNFLNKIKLTEKQTEVLARVSKGIFSAFKIVFEAISQFKSAFSTTLLPVLKDIISPIAEKISFALQVISGAFQRFAAYIKANPIIYEFFANTFTNAMNLAASAIEKLENYLSGFTLPGWLQELFNWGKAILGVFSGRNPDDIYKELTGGLSEAESTKPKLAPLLEDDKKEVAVVKKLKKNFELLMPMMDGFYESSEQASEGMSDLVMSVIRGDWGNGEERIRRLTEAGYDAAKVQEYVNRVFSKEGTFKEGYETILAEIDSTSTGLKKTIPTLEESIKHTQKIFATQREQFGGGKKAPSFITSFTAALTTDVPKIFTWVKGKFDGIVSWFTENSWKIDYILGMLFDSFRNFVNGLPAKVTTIKDTIINVFTTIIGFIEAFTGVDIRFPTFEEIVQFIEDVQNFKSSIPDKLNNLKNAIVSFLEVATGVDFKMPDFSVFDGFFEQLSSIEGGIPDKLLAVKDKIVEFLKTFIGSGEIKSISDNVENDFLSSVLTNIANFINTVINSVKNFVGFIEAFTGVDIHIPTLEEITAFIEDAKAFKSDIPNKIEDIKKILVGFIENVAGMDLKMPDFTIFDGFLEQLSAVEGGIPEKLTFITQKILEFFKTFVGGGEISKVGESIQDPAIKAFFDNAVIFFKGIKDGITGFVKAIVNIPSDIANFNIYGILQKILSVFALFASGSFIYQITQGIRSIRYFINVLSGTEDVTIKDVIKNFFKNLRGGVVEVEEGSKPILVFVKNAKKWLKIGAVVGVIVMFGNMIASIADSVAKIGALKPEQVALGVGAVLGVTLIISLMTAYFMKKANKMELNQISKLGSIAGAMDAFAFAINLLVPPILAFGKMKPEQIFQGVAAFAVISLLLVEMTNYMGYLSKGKDFKVKRILAMAFGMILIANALLVATVPVVLLGALPWKKMALGIAGAAGVLIVLIGAFWLMNKASKDISGGSMAKILGVTAAMVIVSIALIAASVPVIMLGAMPWDKMLIGLGGVLGLVFIFSFISLTLQEMKMPIKGVTSLILMGTALTIAAIPVIALGLIPWDKMLIGLAGVTGLVIGMIVISVLLEDMKLPIKGVTAMILMATGLALLSVPILVLSMIPWDHMIVAILGMIGAVAALLAVSAILTKMSGGIAGAAKLALMGIALIPLAVGLMMLGEAAKSIGDNIAELILLAGVIVALSFAASLIGGLMLGPLLVGIGVITLFALALGFLADSITKFKNATSDAKDIGGNVMEGFTVGIENGIAKIPDLVKRIVKAFLNMLKKMLGIASPSTVMEEIGGFTMEGLLNGLNGGIDGIMNFVKNLGKKFVEGVKKFFTPNNLKNVAKNALAAGKNLISKLWDGIKSGFTKLKDIGSNLINAIKNGIQNFMDSHGLENAGDVIVWAFNGIKNAVVNGVTSAYEIGKSIVGLISTGISNWMDSHGFENAGDVFYWIGKGIQLWLVNATVDAYNIGKGIVDFLGIAISMWMKDHGFEDGGDIIDWICEGIEDLLVNGFIATIDIGQSILKWIVEQLIKAALNPDTALGKMVQAGSAIQAIIDFIFGGGETQELETGSKITKTVIAGAISPESLQTSYSAGGTVTQTVINGSTSAESLDNLYSAGETITGEEISGATSAESLNSSYAAGQTIAGQVTGGSNSPESLQNAVNSGSNLAGKTTEGATSAERLNGAYGAGAAWAKSYNAGVNSQPININAMVEAFKNNGLIDSSSRVAGFGVGSSLSGGVQDGFETGMDMHSPSRVMMGYGENIIKGLAIGINSGSLTPASVSSDMSSNYIDAMGIALTRAHDFLSGSMDVDPTITPVLDLSNVQAGVGMMNSMVADRNFDISASARNASFITDVRRPVELLMNNTNKSNDSLATTLTNIQNEISTLKTAMEGMQVVMNTGALVGAIAAPMDGALGQRVVYKNRRN